MKTHFLSRLFSQTKRATSSRESSPSNNTQTIQMAANKTTKETTTVRRPNLYVKSLTFNDGKTLSVNKNDIVVFVGPNNVGKSQALRDIKIKAQADDSTVIFNAVQFSKEPSFSFEPWLKKLFVTEVYSGGTRKYSEFDFSIYSSELINDPKQYTRPGVFTEALVRFLNTEARLVIANPQDNIDRDETPRHPIHLLRKNHSLRKKISDEFQKAFGVPVFPFERFGKTTPFVLGDYPKLSEDYSDEIEREDAVADIVSRYPHLEKQGDGMRSFIGLMLYLIIDHYNTFLIDEPESFLHPPQSRLMGEIVGNLLSNEQQAFVSTHSIHFIQGLLEKHSDRVKVVRITRTENTNAFSILDKERLQKLSEDPFLKHSSLLEGLFYKNVVLCEADADCMFYSMINDSSDMKGPKGADTLFVHCGGKQRMASVAHDLRDLHVDFRVVPDFDIFNRKDTLKDLIAACGGESAWCRFEKDFNMLSSSIQQRMKNDTTGKSLLDAISALLADNPSESVSNNKKDKIRDLLDETKSEWDRLKELGINGVRSGDATDACNRLLDQLKTLGIHVVPCGELERFVADCGGHGPVWIQKVLDKHPDLSDPVFAEAKEFVKSWNL